MRWRKGRRSANVEDRRGAPSRGGLRMPGNMRMPGRVRIGRRGGIGGGIGTIVLVLVAMYFGVDPSMILGGSGGGGQLAPAPAPGGGSAGRSAAENELADMVSVVLADTEDTWNAIFSQGGQDYPEPKLVLFTGSVDSACGFAQAAMGPFYCPGDRKVYIDLSFYRDLRERHRAPGDFAQAYVVAHEVGHHIQNVLGISGKVQAQRRRVSTAEGNALSVRLELQADCLSGVWANHADRARGILESGDVEEALTAASAIGDDRLQRQARGHVTPDSFTHGTSKQRVRWFRRGMEGGSMEHCDTFSAGQL